MVALRSKLPKEKLYNRNISEPDYVTAIIFHLSTPRLSLKPDEKRSLKSDGNCHGQFYLFVMECWGGGELFQENFIRRSSPTSSLRHFQKKGNLTHWAYSTQVHILSPTSEIKDRGPFLESPEAIF